MKLSGYTMSKVMEEIKNDLFLYWLKSKKSDWKDPEMQELWEDFNKIVNRQVNVIDE